MIAYLKNFYITFLCLNTFYQKFFYNRTLIMNKNFQAYKFKILKGAYGP